MPSYAPPKPRPPRTYPPRQLTELRRTELRHSHTELMRASGGIGQDLRTREHLRHAAHLIQSALHADTEGGAGILVKAAQRRVLLAFGLIKDKSNSG